MGRSPAGFRDRNFDRAGPAGESRPGRAPVAAAADLPWGTTHAAVTMGTTTANCWSGWTTLEGGPPTYLYIDKQMRDHGLFQAICRVNRLDGDDKEFGYIVDYKDLFRSLEGAVKDYTSGALDGYDKEDVAGLLEDRLDKASERLEDALEAVRALCEPVEPPKDDQAYYRYFSSREHGNVAQLAANEPQRLALYKHVASLIRAWANIASEMEAAGYSRSAAAAI